MRKIISLLLTFIITKIILAQGDKNSLPKSIKNIDSLTNKIEREVTQVNSINNDTLNMMIWLIDNHIVKMRTALHYKTHSRSTEHYFNNERLIFAGEKFSKFGEEINTNERLEKLMLSGKWEIFYYEDEEVISKEKLRIEEEDTIFLGIDLLKLGYHLFNQQKHLQNYNPFSSLVYDKVVAYDFDGRGGGQIVERGKLVKDAKNPKSLSAEQIKHFTTTITDTTTYGYGNSMCFDPHLGLVFYQDKKIVAYISICFECNSLFSSVYLPATVHYMGVNEGDDYYVQYPQHGFSPQGRKQLRKLCSELGLQKCPTEDSHWDVE